LKFVKITSIVIGLLIINQWLFFLLSRNVPELITAPIEITFHIIIELITASVLIASAMLFIKENQKSVICIFGQGMLGYTAVNSAGYFVQKGQWPFLIMFGLILMISIINTVILINNDGT
jgi:hypothetical protein